MKTKIINYFHKDLDCAPIDPIIFDTYLEGATDGVINKIKSDIESSADI